MAMSTTEAHDALFRKKAPDVMRLFMADFALNVDQAAAILGNIGTECDGFHHFQEERPTVAGSRGGYGWPQWTGPRRVAYEAYCSRNHLDPAGDKANYGYMFVELRGDEKGAIKALKDVAREGGNLEELVRAFERAYLRAGTPNYPSRNKWAHTAIEAYQADDQFVPPPAAPQATIEQRLGALEAKVEALEALDEILPNPKE
jgi:hypothetical protein